MRLGQNFCPGILHAVPAKDGLLIRIRVPGGLITAAQLAAVASLSAAYANGEVELTSRSNLQLRALLPSSLAAIVSTLAAAGLLPSSAHDRVRNIVTGPFAGIDPTEELDTRALIRELDQRLIASKALQQLHPKFTFGIEGSSTRYTHEVEDLCLQAGGVGQQLRLFLAGTDTGFSVSAQDAVSCLLTAAETCIALAAQHNLPARTKDLLAQPAALEALLRAVEAFLTPCERLETQPIVLAEPIGTRVAAEAGHLNLIPSVPLGHLTAAQAQDVATLAAEHHADLRLAPWRGIVLGNVTAEAASILGPQLAATGLPLDASSGFQGIAACAGLTRCDASHADVRGDAAHLASFLATRPQLSGWSVHLSGCEKQCALRHAASAALVAAPSGYTLRLEGRPETYSLSPGAALAAIVQAHAEALAR